LFERFRATWRDSFIAGMIRIIIVPSPAEKNLYIPGGEREYIPGTEREREREREFIRNNVHNGGVQGAARRKALFTPPM
jgi:hypothetical protein